MVWAVDDCCIRTIDLKKMQRRTCHIVLWCGSIYYTNIRIFTHSNKRLKKVEELGKLYNVSLLRFFNFWNTSIVGTIVILSKLDASVSFESSESTHITYVYDFSKNSHILLYMRVDPIRNYSIRIQIYLTKTILIKLWPKYNPFTAVIIIDQARFVLSGSRRALNFAEEIGVIVNNFLSGRFYAKGICHQRSFR